MTVETNAVSKKTSKPAWYKGLAQYEQANLRKAIWQIVNTILPYFLLWYAMIRTIQLDMSYWITLALVVPASILLVRIFIFFHDCTHGSFFTSRKANRIFGYITGILTFTPFDDWRHSHAIHHSSAGDLDRRGTGDVWTMTVKEYQAASKLQRLAYRLMRFPPVTFILGPPFVFILTHRLPHKDATKKDRMSIHITNLAILAIILLASFTIGLRTYILIQLPVIWIAGMLGIWLFYVQHQFENAYWAHHQDWDPIQAALQGSSYYKLPKVLQWASGNIGFHHIHHLRPRIPNYNLERCYQETQAVQTVTPLTLGASLKSAWLDLWDETQQKLISFRGLKAITSDAST